MDSQGPFWRWTEEVYTCDSVRNWQVVMGSRMPMHSTISMLAVAAMSRKLLLREVCIHCSSTSDVCARNLWASTTFFCGQCKAQAKVGSSGRGHQGTGKRMLPTFRPSAFRFCSLGASLKTAEFLEEVSTLLSSVSVSIDLRLFCLVPTYRACHMIEGICGFLLGWQRKHRCQGRERC